MDQPRLPYAQLLDGLLSGAITVDFAGHNHHYGDHRLSDFKDYVKALKQHYENLSAEGRYSDDSIQVRGALLGNPLFMHEYNCEGCGKSLQWLIRDAQHVRLLDILDEYQSNGNHAYTTCAAASFGLTFKAEIDVPSGELIFANRYYKEEDSIEPGGYSTLRSVLSRDALTQHYASKGFGYGQMGNMSIVIYGNETGDEIIIADNMYWDDDADEEKPRSFPDFKPLGNISLSVWRWMCADRLTLRQHGLEPTEFRPVQVDEWGYVSSSPHVLAPVQPGRWAIEHYYDLQGDNNPIFSKLYLIK